MSAPKDKARTGGDQADPRETTSANANIPLNQTPEKSIVTALVCDAIDSLLADKLTLGEIRVAMDGMPADVRNYFELAMFLEVGTRFQAGRAPWHLVEFFAPTGGSR